jgi:hypothetical protein
MIFKTGLFLHIVGIFLIAGGSLGSVITESVFWKNIRAGSVKAKGIAPLLVKFPPVIIKGAMLMIISGMLMLYSVDWIFWGQAWFTIKLLLFVALILNGRFMGRPTFVKIVVETQSEKPQLSALLKLKGKITRFHIIQFTMLALLVAMVIFKI